MDFASKSLPGFRNNIVKVDQLPGLTKLYGTTDCFSSYFLFDRGFIEYLNNNGGSVSGYQGPCYAHFLLLDIDRPDLGKALETTREITNYMLGRWGIGEEALAIYHSSMKGFHLAIATDAFGEIEPSKELPRIFHELRRSIVHQSKVKHPEAVDFSISERLRLLRLPNTLHSKSGLYKIPLKIHELLSYGQGEIKDVARKPRTLLLTDESGLLPKYRLGPVPGAEKIYKRSVEKAEENPNANLPDPGGFLEKSDLSKALCDAELELYREGVPEGARSSMCLRLASRMRSAGYNQEEASEIIGSFADTCRPPLTKYAIKRIVGVAYRAEGRGYQFGWGTGNTGPPHTRLVHERCSYADRNW